MDDVLSWWGAIAGTAALVLGLWHLAHARFQSRPWLRVEPRLRGLTDTDGLPVFTVQVENQRRFEVRIADAAVMTRKRDGTLACVSLSLGARSLGPLERADLVLTVRNTVGVTMQTFDHAFVELDTGERFRSATRHEFVGRTFGELYRMHEDLGGRPTQPAAI